MDTTTYHRHYDILARRYRRAGRFGRWMARRDAMAAARIR